MDMFSSIADKHVLATQQTAATDSPSVHCLAKTVASHNLTLQLISEPLVLSVFVQHRAQ